MQRGVRVFLVSLMAASGLNAQNATAVRKDSAAGDIDPVTKTAPAEVKVRTLVVYDAKTGEPIEGAEVRDSSLYGRTEKTNKEGRVSMKFLRPIVGGIVLAEVRKPGFRPVHLRVLKEDSTDFGIRLEQNPLGSASLPPMVITDRAGAASFAGFEMRCARRFASCIRQEDFEESPSKTLGDFLKATGSVYVACTGVPGSRSCNEEAQMNGSTGGKCTPTYFVHGFEDTQAPLGGVSKLMQISQDYPTSSIKGVEVYRAEERRDGRFNGDVRCGVIIIWPKQ